MLSQYHNLSIDIDLNKTVEVSFKMEFQIGATMMALLFNQSFRWWNHKKMKVITPGTSDIIFISGNSCEQFKKSYIGYKWNSWFELWDLWWWWIWTCWKFGFKLGIKSVLISYGPPCQMTYVTLMALVMLYDPYAYGVLIRLTVIFIWKPQKAIQTTEIIQ